MAFIRVVDQEQNVYTRAVTLEVDVLYADDPTKDERHFVTVHDLELLSNPTRLMAYIESYILAIRSRLPTVVGTEWRSTKL